MRIWPGSASPGKSRCDGSLSILTSTAPRLFRLDAVGLIYPSFESRAEIAAVVAEREAVGRAIRTARRFIPVTPSPCRTPNARDA